MYLQCSKIRLLLCVHVGSPQIVTFHEIIRETAAAQKGAAVFFKTINAMGNIYIILSFRKPASAVSQFPQQHIRVKKIAAIRSTGCLFKT